MTSVRGVDAGEIIRAIRAATDRKSEALGLHEPSFHGNEWASSFRAFAVRSRSSAGSQQPQEESPKVASIDPKNKEIGRDGDYVAYASGVVRDTKTGLEWVAGPDKDTNWGEAKQWVDNLTVAGGGWRMPTIDELKTLYEKDRGSRNMTPLLETTGRYLWSGETKGSTSASSFDFNGGYRFWYDRSDSTNDRAFAVRSPK